MAALLVRQMGYIMGDLEVTCMLLYLDSMKVPRAALQKSVRINAKSLHCSGVVDWPAEKTDTPMPISL